jgi:transcriptional regulator with XRE-family HTH domain
MLQDIGPKINQLRTEKNMTLKDLAEKCSLSVAFISQIERGLATPAIISLNAIAEALDVDLSYFFNMPKKELSIITRSYEHKPFMVKNSNYIYSELSEHFEGRNMDVLLITILPGSEERYPAANIHNGEEFVYVLEGIVTLVYDDKKYELYPGDSAHYSPGLPHTWQNSTNKSAKILSVNTPVIFREQEIIS